MFLNPISSQILIPNSSLCARDRRVFASNQEHAQRTQKLTTTGTRYEGINLLIQQSSKSSSCHALTPPCREGYQHMGLLEFRVESNRLISCINNIIHQLIQFQKHAGSKSNPVIQSNHYYLKHTHARNNISYNKDLKKISITSTHESTSQFSCFLQQF